MRTVIKTIRTITAVLMIIAGLLALFTIDNAQDITSLMVYAIVMIISISGGIYLLTLAFPELFDLSEFEENSTILNDYEREIEELREHNLLLLNRYITFKSILKSHKAADYSDMTSYPNLYHLIYVEDLTVTEDELERFKEVYN